MDACTIISRNFLPHARVLIESYRRFNPDGRFFVLLLDTPEKEALSAMPPCTFIRAEELGIEDLDILRMRFTAYELSMVLRPFFLQYLFGSHDAEKITYLDADLFFTGPLTAIPALLIEHDIVMTPSFMEPIEDDGLYPRDHDILAAGTFNGGFFACRKSTCTDEVLRWLGARLRTYGYFQPEESMFGDQKWLDLLPSTVESLHIVRDPSYNVAVWNMHERVIGEDRGVFSVNGLPMTFFHFSGFLFSDPLKLSKHQNRIDVARHPALKALAIRYREHLLRAGHEKQATTPYVFDSFSNGVRIGKSMRRIFDRIKGTERFTHPFDTQGSSSFYAWLIKPASEFSAHQSIWNIHLEIHALSTEAKIRFPFPSGRHARAFASWLLDPEQIALFDLDEVFLAPLRTLARRTTWQKCRAGIRALLAKRHGYEPYQRLCKSARRLLGKARFERWKPKSAELVRGRLEPRLAKKQITQVASA